MEIPKFDLQKCIDAKIRLIDCQAAQTAWQYHGKPGPIIGYVSELCRRFQPSSPEEFERMYFENALKHQDMSIADRGCTPEELMKVAKDIKYYTELNSDVEYDLETYYYSTLCHTIVETFDGIQRENEAISFLESLGYHCENLRGKDDAKLGVDIIATKDGKKIGFQVKPKSFFTSTHKDTIYDKTNAADKYKKAKEKLGVRTYFLIYWQKINRSSVQWAYQYDEKLKKKRITFKFNDLYRGNEYIGQFKNSKNWISLEDYKKELGV